MSFFNRSKLPSNDEIQWMSQQTNFTPDIATLEERCKHVLFAIDGLRHGENKFKLIKDHSEYVGHRAYTRHKFNLYQDLEHDLGIPIMGKKMSVHQPLRIKGELQLIDPDGVKILDNMYRNGTLFNRVRVPLLVPGREHQIITRVRADGNILPPVLQGPKHVVGPEKVAVVEGWMYIGASKYWNNALDNGYNTPLVPKKTPKEKRPWLEEFYQYPRNNGQ